MCRVPALTALCVFSAAGCVQTAMHDELPALLTPDAANVAMLRTTLEKSLGQSVTLASDALTRDSTLVIEATPARLDGQRIDGRDSRESERFTLARVGSQCVLVRARTSERFALQGARCTPAAR